MVVGQGEGWQVVDDFRKLFQGLVVQVCKLVLWGDVGAVGKFHSVFCILLQVFAPVEVVCGVYLVVQPDVGGVSFLWLADIVDQDVSVQAFHIGDFVLREVVPTYIYKSIVFDKCVDVVGSGYLCRVVDVNPAGFTALAYGAGEMVVSAEPANLQVLFLLAVADLVQVVFWCGVPALVTRE